MTTTQNITLLTAATLVLPTERLEKDRVHATLLLGSDRDLAELNDVAVRQVRAYCRERGYCSGALYAEEVARINDADMTLEEYLKARRIGSRFRVTRRVRKALWTALSTREALS